MVTEPGRLPEARRLLEADLAAVDLACSRFRADSEIRALRASGGQQVSPLLAEAIAVAGPAPEGGWRIRVQDVTGSPGDPPGGPYALVAIRDGGLATSSTKARRWQRGGDVLHPLLDPRTGRPAEPVWRTVSVAAGTCADANAASTAAVIRGRPRWAGWPGSACRPAWSTRPAWCSPWPAGPPNQGPPNQGPPNQGPLNQNQRRSNIQAPHIAVAETR